IILLTSSTPISLTCSLPLPALHSFPTRRSSDLHARPRRRGHELERIRGRASVPRSRDRRALWRDRAAAALRAARVAPVPPRRPRSEEHTSELESPYDLVCRLLLEKKNSSDREHD